MVPAIFLSLILRHKASALRIGQFSTLALKLRKNLYSLNEDILRELIPDVSSMFADGAGDARDLISSVDILLFFFFPL